MKSNFSVPRIVLKILLALVIISIIGVLVFVGLTISGKNRLYRKNENKKPDLSGLAQSLEQIVGESDEAETEKTPEIVLVEEDNDNWEEGDIRYKGVHYRYNDQILTFLFLGIDHEGSVKQKSKDGYGGQSDSIFLLVLNPKTNQASLIGVNRDTMTDVAVYSNTGVYLMTTKEQIALQHAYGDGKEQSCERSVDAVSNLFYNLPIHAYCSINYGAVPKINDAVGGIDLVMKDDVTNDNGKILYAKGQKVHLKGSKATEFLRARDCNASESARARTERQKQYLLAYADKAKEAIKKDPKLFVTLFNTISKYTVTDITVDEVAYFSTQVADYRFDSEHMYSLQGETKMGDKYEEFYVDEKAMFELILTVFYDVIDD